MLSTVLGAEETFLYKTDKVPALKELASQLQRKTMDKIKKCLAESLVIGALAKHFACAVPSGGEICNVEHGSPGSWHSSEGEWNVNTIIIQCA